jgi:hypothetical protein
MNSSIRDVGTWHLTVDQVVAAGAAAGVQTWPIVLDLPVSTAVETDWAATAHEDPEVADRGEPAFVDLLARLGRPELHFEIRIAAAEPIRACAVVADDMSLLAVREGQTIVLQELSAGVDAVAGAVIGLMGERAAADLRPARAPIIDLAERLAAAELADDYVDALYAAGVPGRDAVTIGGALGACTGHAEIVVVRTADGSTTVSPAAAVVLETPAGRIIASPCVSPDRVLWTTFATGTRQRLRQALALLIETLDDYP